MNDMQSWIVAITQNLVAALIVALASWAVRGKADSIKAMAGTAASAGKRIMPTIMRIALELFILAYLFTLLRGQLTSTDPITRADVFGIAFWTWWLCWYMVDGILRPLQAWTEGRRQLRANVKGGSSDS
jgi:hypothetical protein